MVAETLTETETETETEAERERSDATEARTSETTCVAFLARLEARR
jgi:hypothetical protein